MKQLVVQQMNLEDLELASGWAASEGWNPGLHDARIFYRTDPGGFFIARLGEQPVASISAVRYPGEFGFIGFYIVAPGFRDHGIGGHLILSARKHLEGCRCVGLDGVEAQQANYARHGASYAHDNIRFEGYGSGELISPPEDAEILPLSDVPLDDLLDYDRRHFPADRSGFLKSWISQPKARSLGIIRSGKLTGFGVRRRCRSGYKIAPLFADDPDSASALLSSLREGIGPEEPFYLDAPETNRHAKQLTGDLGMKPVFHTARMYLGETPELPLEEIYGITSFELG
jgi:Acetyltransferase (GNAT) domain/Acetyltransferase (GNAT) family